ncbi:MAG: VTT domain-containing protein [Candidatus Aenigmarchaeota archaeon]|nr:VTT domain-containing protein [Candidatus Aenigmarchaeota archaeon]
MDFSAFSGFVAGQWGYLGILVIQLISSSTVFLPLPGLAIIFLYGAMLNPYLVGLFAGTGAAVGELTGYAIGYGGHKLILRTSKNKKIADKIRRLFRRYDYFFVIIFFSAIPFPFDIIGVLCGLSKYDVKRFFVATFIGNSIKFSVVALAGFYGTTWVLKMFGG